MSDKLKDGRWRLVRVSSALLSEVLRGRMKVVSSTTAPSDLEVVGLHQAVTGPGEYHFVVWSASFESVPEGEQIPFADLEYRT